MKYFYFIFILFLSGCESSVNIHKEWYGVKYYRIEFHDREIRHLPPEARLVKGQKNIAIGVLNGNRDTGPFVVSGYVTGDDYTIEPMWHFYDYAQSFMTLSHDGKIKPFVAYKITNRCQPDDIYTGISDKHGRTILFSTEKPCDLDVEILHENYNE